MTAKKRTKVSGALAARTLLIKDEVPITFEQYVSASRPHINLSEAATLGGGEFADFLVQLCVYGNFDGRSPEQTKDAIVLCDPSARIALIDVISNVLSDEKLAELFWPIFMHGQEGMAGGSILFKLLGPDCSLVWRDRVVSILPSITTLEQFWPLLVFVLNCCVADAEEFINEVFDLLTIDHFITHDPTLVEKCALHLKNANKPVVLEAFKKRISRDVSAVSVVFLCLWWHTQVPDTIKFVKSVWKRWQDAAGAKPRASNQASSRAVPSIYYPAGLAEYCAVEKLTVARLFFPDQVIKLAVALLTRESFTSWALQVLFAAEVPDLLPHQGMLLVVFDYLERLKVPELRQFYVVMWRVADYDQRTRDELMIIFRKQTASLDPQVRLYGVQAVLAGISDYCSAAPERGGRKRGNSALDVMDDEQPSCSQAPAAPSVFDKDIALLLERAVSPSNPERKSVVHLCKEIVTLLPTMTRPVVGTINKLISGLFEDHFIVELSKDQGGTDSLDGDNAAIGVLMYKDEAMPHLFTVLAAVERIIAGSLDNIDALLGCPIMMVRGGGGGAGPSLLTSINWWRSIINAFGGDQGQRLKCLKRWERLQEMQLDYLLNGTESRRMAETNSHPTEVPLWEQMKMVSLTESGGGTVGAPFLEVDPLVMIQYLGEMNLRDFLLEELLSCDLHQRSEPVLQQMLQSLVELFTDEKQSQHVGKQLRVVCHVLGQLKRRRGGLKQAIELRVEREYFQPLPLDQLSGQELEMLSVFVEEGEGGRDVWRNYGQFMEKYVWTGKCLASSLHRLLPAMFRVGEDRVVGEMVGTISASAIGKKRTVMQAEVLAYLGGEEGQRLGWAERFDLFERLVGISRAAAEEDPSLIEGTLRHGRVFLTKAIKEGLPRFLALLATNNDRQRQGVMEVIKKLQVATRSLQIICNHVKGSKELYRWRGLLPPMKKELERLVYEVKRGLQSHGCLSAFWMGNLRHRSIDGNEIGSQIPVE